jgi:hypothetical protein
VLRWLEGRLGASRTDLRSPEKEFDPAPVEITCRLGDQLYALEHTGVEPFEGHVRLQAEAERDFGPIYAGVAGKLPPGDLFELHVPARAMQSLGRREREVAQAGMVAWVIAKAPTAQRTDIGRYATPIMRERPHGVPFDLSLHRFAKPASLDRAFSITHIVQSATSDGDRDARIEQACARKFPKLAAWRNRGAQTILVLEDNDLQLSNPQTIYEAVARAERKLGDGPDEIHLVVTCMEPDWAHFRLRAGALNYYQLSQLGGQMTLFDPRTLVDLMAVL